MNKTLINGLREKWVQAKVEAIDVRPYYYTRHFPLMRVNQFNWRTLAGGGGYNVAADIAADHATIEQKKRPVFTSATGDIPRIAIAREMNRLQLKDYQVALALAGDATAAELVRYWADDVEYCFRGVQNQLDYLAWALLTNAGKLDITKENNAYTVTEFSLDYGVDEWQKVFTAADWGVTGTKGLDHLRTAINNGKKRGLNLKHAFMNLNTLYKFATQTATVNAAASILVGIAGKAQTPSLESINAMLATQAWLNGLQIHVIDVSVVRESVEGTQEQNVGFADDVVVLSETPILGSTQYSVLQTNEPNVIRVERGHTVIKKYSEPQPLKEVTLGEADAIPVLDTAYRNMYLKVGNTKWDGTSR